MGDHYYVFSWCKLCCLLCFSALCLFSYLKKKHWCKKYCIIWINKIRCLSLSWFNHIICDWEENGRNEDLRLDFHKNIYDSRLSQQKDLTWTDSSQMAWFITWTCLDSLERYDLDLLRRIWDLILTCFGLFENWLWLVSNYLRLDLDLKDLRLELFQLTLDLSLTSFKGPQTWLGLISKNLRRGLVSKDLWFFLDLTSTHLDGLQTWLGLV